MQERAVADETMIRRERRSESPPRAKPVPEATPEPRTQRPGLLRRLFGR